MAAWKSSTNIFTVKPWTGNYGDETAGNVQDDIHVVWFYQLSCNTPTDAAPQLL